MRKSVCVLVAGLFILFNVSAQTAPSPEEAQLREQLLDTEARRQEITGEASPELVSLNLSDTGVSLLLSGFWKGSLLGKWGVSKSKLGWTIAPTDSPILFTQEADLTLSLWVNSLKIVQMCRNIWE